MTLPSPVVALAAAGAVVLALLVVAKRALHGRALVAARYVGAGLLVAIFFAALGAMHHHALAVQVAKAAIALAAAGAIVHERERASRKRPIAERWKRAVAACLALAALAAYWNGFSLGSRKYYHRWEQYHYYMGAKYFRELGYDGLYRCTAVAQDELGVVEIPGGRGPSRSFDMAADVRRPGRKIRNLGGDNLLGPVTDALAHPEACKRRFSRDRWESYKADVRFFRLETDTKYWDGMQRDKGYNPPPVWTLGGFFFASMFPAGKALSLPLIGETLWVQILAMLDLVYLAGTFAAVGWAFGFRAAAVTIVFFGTQAWAPIAWTQGAFLRQDWLFWMVLSASATRKRRFVLAGAALAYASLLRVFPAVTAVGWVVLAGLHLLRHRTLSPAMWRTLAGASLAALVLVPASMAVAGTGSYRQFAEHTLVLHDETPATNRMGIRMLLTQDPPFEIGPFGRGPESGRMKFARDEQLEDPFADWMGIRNRRWARWRYAAYGLGALCLAGFAFAMRRVRSLWIAQCASHLFIVLFAQLASYYYASMILLAPLTLVRRRFEVALLGAAALSEGVVVAVRFADDRHWALSLLCLGLCVGAVAMFVRVDRPAKVATSEAPP